MPVKLRNMPVYGETGRRNLIGLNRYLYILFTLSQYICIKLIMASKVIYQVDAFTSEPFSGNPAGVCITEKEEPSGWMQNIAAEMNLSETAFLFSEGGMLNIRFFTPEAEIDLCGHATLSSAHILFETGLASPGQVIMLSSKAGILSARKDGEWISLDFPSYGVKKTEIPEKFLKASGINPPELYRTSNGWALAVCKTEEEVKKMSPDFAGLCDSGFGDLIVTAPSGSSDFDYVLRCFAPALGINEDPVTGSAQCVLVPYWNARSGKKEFKVRQLSARGGVLRCLLQGNRVIISGQAKTVFRAELFV